MSVVQTAGLMPGAGFAEGRNVFLKGTGGCLKKRGRGEFFRRTGFKLSERNEKYGQRLPVHERNP